MSGAGCDPASGQTSGTGRQVRKQQKCRITLGENFVQGVERTCTLEGFPRPGESVEIQWSESLQNFVITKAEW